MVINAPLRADKLNRFKKINDLDIFYHAVWSYSSTSVIQSGKYRPQTSQVSDQRHECPVNEITIDYYCGILHDPKE